MNEWLPVVGTLAGVAVTGIISFALHWLSSRDARHTLNTNLSEERAKWAAEYELDRISKFSATIEKLLDAIGNFRVQQAWDAFKETPPEWVPSYEEAREGIEIARAEAASEVLLFDENVQSEFRSAFSAYDDWMIARTTQDGVDDLCRLEHDISEFKKYLAAKYREVFNHRRSGTDI